MVIKIESCAICGTDLKILKFGNPRCKPPQVIGHEFVGKVIEKDETAKGFQIGDRITMATSIPCGKCHFCNRGLGNLCNNLKCISYDFPGAFAEFMAIPAEGIQRGNVLQIPNNLSSDKGALSEPLGCVINSQMISGVGIGKTVAILGAGPLGCLHAEAAKANGASKVIVTEGAKTRLELAQRLNVDTIIDITEKDAVTEVMRLTNGLGADIVIVVAPVIEAHEQSLEMVKKNGTINFFASLPKDNPYLKINSRLIHYRQIFLTGASDSCVYHQKIALDMLARGKINTEVIITHHFPLYDLYKGFEIMEKKEGLKVIINPGGIEKLD